MENVIEWILENKLAIWTTLTTIVVAANAIAKLTPTDSDDKFIEKVRVVIEKVGNMFLPDLELVDKEDEE